MAAIFILLLAILTVIPGDDDSAYEEYCNLECRSRKSRCCN